MSSHQAISSATFERALLLAGDRLIAAKDELCALDAAAGDGDLGVTLASGFGHVRDSFAAESPPPDVGAALGRVGSELGRKAPSTIGALLATAFIRAGASAAGRGELEGPDIASILHAAASGVAERGRATANQRTILDAMLAAADRGEQAVAVLAAAAVGARAGADATAGMEPALGRAVWIKDRARGIPDAGAVAWAIFLEGLADGCNAGEPEGVRQGV
jgi:phosphoenolpyruvate---glycerone phosphotransferase subunit DhaL